MELDQWGETGGGLGQPAPSRRSQVLVNVFTIVRLPDNELYNAYRDACSSNSCIQRGMTRRKAPMLPFSDPRGPDIHPNHREVVFSLGPSVCILC